MRTGQGRHHHRVQMRAKRAAFCTGTVLDWTQIRLYRYSHFVLSDRLLLAVTRNLGVAYGGHVAEGPSYVMPEAYWEF